MEEGDPTSAGTGQILQSESEYYVLCFRGGVVTLISIFLLYRRCILEPLAPLCILAQGLNACWVASIFHFFVVPLSLCAGHGEWKRSGTSLIPSSKL